MLDHVEEVLAIFFIDHVLTNYHTMYDYHSIFNRYMKKIQTKTLKLPSPATLRSQKGVKETQS